MAKKKAEGYLTAKESRRISRSNKKIKDALEKKEVILKGIKERRAEDSAKN